MPQIVVNGEERDFGEGETLEDLLRSLGVKTGPGLIVERNGTVVPHGDYGGVRVQEGDRLELVRLVGGG